MYDYMGRRVRKDVFIYNGAWPQDGDPDERWHFVYDGWNVVMVLDGLNSNAVKRKYTWGLDLSGTIHGAGGIGGLLACEEPQTVGDPKRYWFIYDANGNVGQVLDATSTSNITIAAHYEYDPYGNVINSTGPYKDVNPFRFSTKWFDDETHLGYWGYRYYSPRLGRWISRDPIGEDGGRNLYAAMANSPLSWFDPNGAEATTQPTSQPDINNLDPSTYLGQRIASAPSHKTTCGIYVVRKTFGGRQWPGHTFIMWPGGSVGFSGGGRIISEQQDTVRAVNTGKLAVSVYVVDYVPKSDEWVGTGLHQWRKVYSLAYGAGPEGVKGKCCPDKPNCRDLVACLSSQVGTSVKGFEKNTVFTNPLVPSEVNCNSFARFALERCCLRRGKRIVNGYTGAFVKYEPILVFPKAGFNFYDDEAGNLWGWNNGPTGLQRCSCSVN